MKDPYLGEFGRWIYKTLPQGMRVAGIDDFRTERGVEPEGINFLVHTYHSNEFEHHVSKHGVVEKFRPWIVDGRVYVKSTNQ